MSEKKEKFYITTAIAYANAPLHMGHAYEAFLADVIARYKREEGKDVFFLTGSDEHGAKIVRAAKESGVGPQAFVDKNTGEFKNFYQTMSVGYDDFIRTSDSQKHWPGAVALWKKIFEAGDIYKNKYKGLYCVGCEAFITEKELTADGFCPDHNKKPEEVEEENYFFRLSKYAGAIKEKIETNELLILPAERKNEILAFLKEGLEDVSFSRPESTIPWGIPVPEDNSQTMYVWCDALSNYISALGFGSEEKKNFERFWPADVHVIGKGIIRFHAVFWPAMLLSAGLPLPQTLLVHGYITSEGKKMSKSIGNVVDPKEYIEKYGAEALRAYFAKEISPFEDGDFTRKRFIDSYNANLANGLGNLLSRTVKMAAEYFGGIVKERPDIYVPLKHRIETLTETEEGEGESVREYIENTIAPAYRACMDRYEMHHASQEIWKLLKTLDGYVTDYEPYKLVKDDKDKTEAVIWNLLYGISRAAELLTPLMPETAKKIDDTIGRESGETISFSVKSLPAPLFARIISLDE